MIFSEGLQNQKEFYMQGRKLTMCDSLMTKARTLAPISMEACCCQRLQLFDVHSFWFAKLWNAQGFFQPLVFFSLNHLLFSVMRYLLPWCGGPDNTQRSSFDQMWSSNLRPDEAFDDRLPEAWYFRVKMLVNFRMPVFTDGETMTECGSFFWFQDMVVTKIAEISPTSGAGRKSIKVCWVLGSTSKRKDSIRAICLFSRRSFKQSILKYIHVFMIPFLSGGPSRAERHVAPKAQPRARLAITAKSKPPQGKSDDFTMVFTDVQGFSLRSWNFRVVCFEFFWKTGRNVGY